MSLSSTVEYRLENQSIDTGVCDGNWILYQSGQFDLMVLYKILIHIRDYTIKIRRQYDEDNATVYRLLIEDISHYSYHSVPTLSYCCLMVVVLLRHIDILITFVCIIKK